MTHCVNIEVKETCEVYPLRNHQILSETLEMMGQNIIYFVQVVYGFRIKTIVLDFIRDSKGEFYMTDIKNFTFDEYEKIRYLRV